MKILRPGEKEFTAECNKCGCLFSYNILDVHLGDCVICPDCGGFVVHSLEKPVKRTDFPVASRTVDTVDKGAARNRSPAGGIRSSVW